MRGVKSTRTTPKISENGLLTISTEPSRYSQIGVYSCSVSVCHDVGRHFYTIAQEVQCKRTGSYSVIFASFHQSD